MGGSLPTACLGRPGQGHLCTWGEWRRGQGVERAKDPCWGLSGQLSQPVQLPVRRLWIGDSESGPLDGWGDRPSAEGAGGPGHWCSSGWAVVTESWWPVKLISGFRINSFEAQKRFWIPRISELLCFETCLVPDMQTFLSLPVVVPTELPAVPRLCLEAPSDPGGGGITLRLDGNTEVANGS